MDPIAQKVREIAVQDLGDDIDINDIEDSWTLAGQLDLDSIELTEYALRLEEAFDIEIPDDMVTASMTVGDVVEVVRKLRG